LKRQSILLILLILSIIELRPIIQFDHTPISGRRQIAMTTVAHSLAATPRRFLLAIGRARGLSLPWAAPKARLVEILAEQLSNPAGLDRLLPGLSRPERTVLNDILLAGGRVARRYLVEQYGDLRPYRPWRSDEPNRPWEAAISPPERLWYLGLIFLDQATDELIIPTDIRPHLALASPPPPLAVPAPSGPAAVDRACHDLACLLALLQRDDISPRHGRWLPSRFLTAWGDRCAIVPTSPGARSERHTGRRRFLHYLAENAGWLGVNDQLAMSNEQLSGSNPAMLKTGRQALTLRKGSRQVANLSPSPAAWLWLNSSRAERLQTLWQTWNRPDPERWAAFRLPGYDWLTHPPALLTPLHETLPQVDPADPAEFARTLLKRRPDLRDLAPANRFEPLELLAGTIVDLLTGPLTWLGVLSINNEQLTLNNASFSMLNSSFADDASAFAKFAVTSDIQADPLASSLTLTVPDGLPEPADLAVAIELSESEHVPPPLDHYLITPVSFVRALHRGWSPPALLDALNRLAQEPLTGQAVELLRAWSDAAGLMAIRTTLLLEVTEPEIITRLAATRRGRALIHRTLSPRAVVVDPARLDPLVRRLTAQEGAPPQLVINNEQLAKDTPGSLSSAEAAQAWLALQVYQGLGRYIRLPARTSQALLDRLARLATPADLAAAGVAAEQTLAELQPLFDGRAPFPAWSDEGLPEADSLPIIEAALANGHNLDLHYYAASTDRLTHRIVEPYRLEWRGDTPYLIGFCHHAQAERTFRVDRIRAIELVSAYEDPIPDEPDVRQKRHKGQG
jgi:hypothetical protein